MYVPRVKGPRPEWWKLLTQSIADTYKGDSDAKRIARHLCWRSIYYALGGAEQAGSMRVFTLASRFGGDIAWLTGAGVGAANVLACDRSASAARECAARWPNVRVVVGDAAEVFLASEPKRFDCAMLDFCGPLGPDTMGTILRVVRSMRFGAVLALGFMRGRERDVERGFLPATRHRRRAAASASRSGGGMNGMSPQHLLGIDSGMRSWVQETNERIRAIRKAEPKNEKRVLSGTVRVLQLQNMVAAMFPNEVFLEVLCTFDYQSATDGSNGVPMSYVAFRKCRRESASEEARGVVDGSSEKLRELALKIEADGYDAAMLLDLPRGTVRAWKAHDTRGTYA